MVFIVKGILVVLVMLCCVALDVFLRFLDWTLTPSGQARKVEAMEAKRLESVNNELFVAFGHREAAGDPDEAVTTPYTTELDRRAMYERAVALQELDVHVEYETGDEFV